jgi:prepilin-type N-terminal cleavage/methylation domain-containing protein
LSKVPEKLGNARGFTLVEVVVVLVFIGLIASLTTPFLMSTLDRIKHQAETRKINSALRFARSEAIARKVVFTFNGDMDNRQYWIAAKEKSRATSVRTLAPGYAMAHVTGDDETIKQGNFAINFFPRGNSNGGAIRVTKRPSDKTDTAYEITIDAITGTSRINQETR